MKVKIVIRNLIKNIRETENYYYLQSSIQQTQGVQQGARYQIYRSQKDTILVLWASTFDSEPYVDRH